MNDPKLRKVLVVGAAGRFAGLILPELRRRHVTTRAFIRRPEERVVVEHNGAAETAIGDIGDSGSVRQALQGIDSVFYIAPQFLRNEASVGVKFVEACRNAGVRRFVQSSILHPVLTSVQVHAAKVPVEAAVVESGMEFSILQLAMFYQDITAAWPEILKTAEFKEPFSKSARVARVDFRDVAEVVAIALVEDRLVHGTFELCAPGYLNRTDVATIMSEMVGTSIKAGEVPFDAWAKATSVKDDDYGPESEMYSYYGEHGSPGNSLVLKAILGREPRSLRDFIKDLLTNVPTTAS